MKLNYKLMGVFLCGAMLLASGCGASKQAASESVAESVASQPVAAESVAESEPEETPASPAVSEAASEVPAESEAEPEKQPETASKAESKAESKATSTKTETKQEKPAAASSKAETSKPEGDTVATAPAAPAESATLETALKYVGKDVSKLYAAVGKPNSTEYASSCIGDGEDGILYYNGFTVTTYRENGKETVQDAY